MAENDLDRGPVSAGGIAPRPLFAVGAVLLGAFLANFDSRLTTVGLPDLRGAFSLGFDEGAWLSTAGIGSQILVAPAVAWLATVFGMRRVLGIPSLVYALISLTIPFVLVVTAAASSIPGRQAARTSAAGALRAE